jgi:hypothetical protein
VLFATARSRKLPHLAEYVTRMAKRSPEGEAAQAAGCALSLLMSGVAFVMLMRLVPFWFAGSLTLFLVLPLLSTLASLWIKQLSQPKTEAEERRKEAHEAILFMKGALSQGKLHRRLDRAVGLLLEECARHWLRVQQSLSGSFWEDKDLPSHWKLVREQSLQAADRAMDDIIVMLKPVLQSRSQASKTQEMFGDMLESFFDVDTGGPIEPIPAAFLPARDIAQKLKQLADEVEETAQRAVRDETFRDQFSSSTQIDQVLGELRAIKEAETELHQEIGRPPGDEP